MGMYEDGSESRQGQSNSNGSSGQNGAIFQYGTAVGSNRNAGGDDTGIIRPNKNHCIKSAREVQI